MACLCADGRAGGPREVIMRVAIDRDALLAVLDAVHGAANPRGAVPILGNVRLAASCRDGLTAACCDLDMLLEASTTPDGPAINGVVTAEVGRLHALVRRLPKGTKVELAAADGHLCLNAAGFSARLPSLPAEEFPTLAGPEGAEPLEAPGQELARAFGTVAHAASTEEVRYYLNGVCVRPADDGLVLCATDGHRLCELRLGLPGRPPLPDAGVIVPRAAFRPIHRLAAAAGDERVMLVSDGRTLAASNRRWDRLVTRLVDGTFPAYERLIPQDRTDVARVARADLLEAVQRAAVLAADGPVRLVFGAQALDVGVDGAGGSAGERVPMSFDGEPRALAFNPRYLADMLGALAGGHVELLPGQPAAPLLVRDPEGDPTLRYLLMPMRA